MRTHKLEIELWKYRINVVFGSSPYEALEHYDLLDKYCAMFETREKGEQDARGADALWCIVDGYHLMIFKEDAPVNQIAHECFHAVCHMMREKGVPFSEDTEEVFAYALDYLIKRVLKLQQKKK